MTQALHSSSFVSMEITFVAMSALIPLLANASVAFFGEPNLTKCIFLTARVTVAMILKVNLAKNQRRNEVVHEIQLYVIAPRPFKSVSIS